MCAAYHMPHSEFLGWSALDRDKAVWWEARQRAVCQQCGTRPEEWDAEQGGNMHAYIGTVAHCRGCEVRAGEQDRFDKAPKNAYRRGSYVTLVPNPERS